MKGNIKRKWIELFSVTELFRCYFQNKATEKEKKVIENWEPEEGHQPDLHFLMPDEETEQLWQKIALQAYLGKKKRLSLRHYYAAAVMVALLVSSIYVLTNGILQAEGNTVPAVVDSGRIKIGTDKSTLTLEDGSQVYLEKGTTYQTNKAKSNGTQLVYHKMISSRDKTTELETPIVVGHNYLTVPRGGQFFVKLSDGTQVWLNSETQLKYPVSFTEGETRKVELVYGEAYFDVSPGTEHKGARFKVYSDQQEVEVVGTEFNLKAYKEEANVYTTLIEGEVVVNTQGKRQYLVPDQQSNLDKNNNSIQISTVDVYNEISWKEGVFSFENKPLAEIMKVLSRWYDIEVVFESESAKNEEFIGVLRKDQDIESIISTIRDFGTIKEYEFKDKVLLLR